MSLLSPQTEWRIIDRLELLARAGITADVALESLSIGSSQTVRRAATELHEKLRSGATLSRFRGDQPTS